ncbi:MAG: hypothetical protein A2X56_10785 [Nitrospirae bacterium GWC2_57_13]|nr:MAG: hypothetical protein A2X56_10785 [Nitrospirae bacterium GWC2_57_13]HAS55485.1 hypothetical protein [Nitrospiraceae bacterium]
METLREFVGRFSTSVGCYYHGCRSGIYSLKKVNSEERGKQQVFAWVQERKSTNLFRIDTYEHLAVEAGVIACADGKIDNMNWDKAGVFYNVGAGSAGEDFRKAVRALRKIHHFR